MISVHSWIGEIYNIDLHRYRVEKIQYLIFNHRANTYSLCLKDRQSWILAYASHGDGHPIHFLLNFVPFGLQGQYGSFL